MKTITEFSGILLQRAAEAQRAYRAEHPQISTPDVEAAPPAPAAAEEATASEDVAGTEPAAIESAAAEETSDGAAASGEAASSEGGAGDGGAEAQPEPAPAVDLGRAAAAERAMRSPSQPPHLTLAADPRRKLWALRSSSKATGSAG